MTTSAVTSGAKTVPPAPSGPPPHVPTRTGGQDTTTVDAGRRGVDAPAGTRGKTIIATGVVEKIAGMAAREVPGVYALGGGGLSRTLGAVRDRVPGGGGRAGLGRGVKVEVGERQTAIDLDVIVEYGVSIQDCATDIRENVISALERITGLEVVEVNISIGDVHLPDDDTAQDSDLRLQ
ncbi:Asp23/Gls24 family envelope stress response protein [Streptomyces fuscigenes]|uniref:Asp23/Gls24 family envelope stress response protein n=1 Tax=Streptomyces fuscigenes TaxID=1528880 RepID=UPI001F3F0666|nr:Asp23/Gls24 family envelope stress response protein [Streptomyces fuscigenes]MCF3960548.1 Asp23/Gls24 family envelope stress response protein [Streptomyces fuscigenes]